MTVVAGTSMRGEVKVEARAVLGVEKLADKWVGNVLNRNKE